MSTPYLFKSMDEPSEPCPLCQAKATFVRFVANQALFVCKACNAMGRLDFSFSVVITAPRKADPRRQLQRL